MLKIIARQLIRLFRLLADFLIAAAIALMMALLAIGLAIALPNRGSDVSCSRLAAEGGCRRLRTG